MTTTLEAARELISRGWAPVPIAYRKKKPADEGWPELRITAEDAVNHFNGHPQNIGVILGDASDGLVDVDLDAMEAVKLAGHFLPETGAIFGREGKPQSHWLYRVPGLKTMKFQFGSKMIVELRSTGGQTVVPPSVHPSGEPVTWYAEGEPAQVSADELVQAVRKVALAALLVRHFPEHGRNDTALAIAGVLLRAKWSDEEVEDFIEVVAEEGGSCDVPAKVKTVADTRAKLDAGEEVTGLPTLKDLLGDDVGKTIGKFLGTKAPRERAPNTALGCTDVGNGERFVRDHGKDVRYCYEWKCWLIWDGRRWDKDGSGEVERRAQQTARAILKEAATVTDLQAQNALVKWAQNSQSWPRLQAMLQTARSGLTVRPDELDQHPWLFNVRNGTLDLRTGELGSHQRSHLLTRLAPVDYDPAATCPLFHGFLDRIMAKDVEMVAFLRRAVGYALTGETGEQCYFLLHGDGANGKSTFLEVIQSALGDYARPTEFRTLLHRDKSDAVRNDLAALRGLRLVTAVEAGQGKRLDEALVKQLTGSDRITARFLYGEFFDFYPVFKLFLAANHKPEIRGVDEGIWRRVKLVPFEVTIPTAERDRHLLGKLRLELPGILAWAMQGCLEWQQVGLQEPDKVSAATTAYRHESDQLADFLGTRCLRAADVPDQAPELLKVTAADLYAAYKLWAEDDAGAEPWKKNTFGRALKERGFTAEPMQHSGRVQRVYIGLALRSDREKF